MNTQLDTTDTQTQQDPRSPADPIDQALELLSKFGRGEPVCTVGGAAIERSAAFLLASVGIAIAHHLSRLADAAEQRNQHLDF